MSNSSNKGGSEREFQKLSRAVTEAVMQSEKIRKIVNEIQKKEKLCSNSFMVLVLNMQTLMQGMEPNCPEATQEKKPARRTRKRKSHEQFIDGKKLSKNEMAFEEYIQDQFSDKDWLRKNRLKL